MSLFATCRVRPEFSPQALRYINLQKRVQEYTFVFKHSADVDNKVVDALSKRLCTLQALNAEVIGFECHYC